jgi:hypothetical protein
VFLSCIFVYRVTGAVWEHLLWVPFSGLQAASQPLPAALNAASVWQVLLPGIDAYPDSYPQNSIGGLFSLQ